MLRPAAVVEPRAIRAGLDLSVERMGRLLDVRRSQRGAHGSPGSLAAQRRGG